MEESTYLIILFVGCLVSYWLGGAVTAWDWKDEAVARQCAHYDPTTADFKWNDEEKKP